MLEQDSIIIIDDEQPNVFHVISKKAGELGIIFKPEKLNNFCFRQTNLSKFLKTYHIATILTELNIKNDIETEKK